MKTQFPCLAPHSLVNAPSGPPSGPSSRLRILHLEDNATDAELIRASLEAAISCEIHRVETKESFRAALENAHYDLVLSDYTLPSFDGLCALDQVRHLKLDTPFIFVSGTIGEEKAVESLKLGATDYVLKSHLVRLVSVIERAIRDARRRAEQRQSELKIREQATLLDQVPDAVFVCDLEERVTYWSKGAERMYGWTAMEVQARSTADLINRPGELRWNPAEKTILEQLDWLGELRQVTKLGKEILVASRRTVLHDPSGKPISILNIHTDITDKKQLEAQFLRNQRLENLGTLASGIAHDLNNILAPVLMGADVLRDRLAGEAERRVLETIKSSALRGSELVNQILQFARGVQGEPIPIQLKALINEMIILAKDTFPRSISFRQRMAPDLRLIVGDATQIRQLLLNLYVNARDAMPQGGTLTVEASVVTLDRKVFSSQPEPVSGQFVLLMIADTGTGIAPHLADRIFQPFFTTKSAGQGTGLGLSTVANIVQNHKGFIEVASQLGKGTIFSIYLPASSELRLPSAPVADDVTPAGRGEWLLLVDDESAVREMTKVTLEAFHYHVLTANNGAEALVLFEQHRESIKIVVTDLMMPIVDGLALIRHIRQRAPDTRIICISGLASAAKLAQLDRTNVHALLRKPYTSNQLLAVLNEVIVAA